jgi:hypothetical protein
VLIAELGVAIPNRWLAEQLADKGHEPQTYRRIAEAEQPFETPKVLGHRRSFKCRPWGYDFNCTLTEHQGPAKHATSPHGALSEHIRQQTYQEH